MRESIFAVPRAIHARTLMETLNWRNPSLHETTGSRGQKKKLDAEKVATVTVTRENDARLNTTTRKKVGCMEI